MSFLTLHVHLPPILNTKGKMFNNIIPVIQALSSTHI